MRLMRAHVLLLQYRKVTTDGGNRFALATLMPSYYAGYLFQGRRRRVPGLIVYWDVGKRQWRSFYWYNLDSFAVLR